MKSVWLILVLEASLMLTILPSCREGEARAEANVAEKAGSTKTASAATVQKVKPLNVKIETLKPDELTESIVGNGTTKALREVTYSAEIPGKIEYLAADLGDRVRRGQVLARIDFKTLKAQANQATANHTLANTTFTRFSALKNDDLISDQQIDEARSKLTIAQSQMSIAKANLSKSVIRASYPGIVNARHVEKSEYVAPGTRIFDVVDYRTIIVEAQLAETQVAHIRSGAKVDVQINALNEKFEGVVDTVIPTANKESKTFTLRVKIANRDLKILIGMSAQVRITAETHRDAIVISQGAVIEESHSRTVFVAKDGVAEKRRIKLGAIEGDRVLVTEGLAAGEQLIVVGQRDLVDGQPIRIVP